MSINNYTGNQFEIMDDSENRSESGSLCPPSPCCLSNFYSCLFLPFLRFNLFASEFMPIL